MNQPTLSPQPLTADPHAAAREAARERMNDAADYAEAMERAWFESAMLGYTGAPLPQAPDVPAAAVAEARRRLAAQLDRQRAAEPVASLRASFERHRRGLDARQGAALDRLVDDWIACDAGWPEASLAQVLADQAAALGDDDVAQVLEAMHHSQLLDFQVAPRPRRKPLPAPGDLRLLRMSTHEPLWVTAPPLGGRPPEDTWLQARLWPAGEGRWTLAPGLIVRSGAPELTPQPDSPSLHPFHVQERLDDLLQAWCAELRHARRLARLLPA